MDMKNMQKNTESSTRIIELVPQTSTFKIQEINDNELDSEKLMQAQQIFVSYFTDLYKDIPPAILGIENVPNYLKEIFNKTKIALNERTIRGFLAYIDDEPVGFSTCGLLEDSTMLLLRTMPIHLAYKDKAIEIYNAFLAYSHQQFPTAQSIVMMVRKANVVQASLCRQTGFTKNHEPLKQSTYLKANYSSEWYEAYIYHFIKQ